MEPQRPRPGEPPGPAGASGPPAGTGPAADAGWAADTGPLPAAGPADPRPFLERYVRDLTAMGAIQSADVERAFTAVERHRLLETFFYRPAGAEEATVIRNDPDRPLAEHLAVIYADDALATRHAGGLPSSSTSQPSLVAKMIHLLGLGRGMKVLEIGAGTGYNAALMAEITGSQQLVLTIDVQEDVVAQTRRLLAAAGYPRIRVLAGDGADGAEGDAPFDRIVATVGCSDLSPAWARQLAGDGRMLVPLEHPGGHPLVLLGQENGQLRGRIADWTGFMPVRGPLHIKGMWERGTVVPPLGDVVGQRPPWPGFSATEPGQPPGSHSAEIGLLFFLGLHDRRACLVPGAGVGLTAGPDGWVGAGPAGIRWWKDPALADELERLYQQWCGLGRPRLGDYEVSFTPIAEAPDPSAGGWQIERRFFREIVQLGR